MIFLYKDSGGKRPLLKGKGEGSGSGQVLRCRGGDNLFPPFDRDSNVPKLGTVQVERGVGGAVRVVHECGYVRADI